MAIINGTSNGDTLFGNSVADTVSGLGGNDRLLGGADADSLGGGDGSDTLLGGVGDASLAGGRGADSLAGGLGLDTASDVGSLGGVSVNLATGVLFGGDAEGDRLSGIENVVGTSFEDFLVGNGVANVLGGGGNDVINGRGGNDVIDGGEGQDSLDGGGGSDTVSYRGSTEGVGVNLLLNGGGGGDTLASIESVDGSLFNDFLFGDNQDNRLQVFDGDDRLRGFIGNDFLSGGSGGDILLGGFSNDTLDGGTGADVLNGEENIDTPSYAASSSGVKASLNPADGAGEGGDAQGDRVFNVENITGSAFADFLAGSASSNVLTGGGDFLIGDSGEGRFDFNALTDAGDVIADFSDVAGSNDMLGFEGDVFGNLPVGALALPVGALAANRFVANTAGVTVTPKQRFVYDTDIGVLSYDANGSAAGGVTAICQPNGAPTLTFADIMII